MTGPCTRLRLSRVGRPAQGCRYRTYRLQASCRVGVKACWPRKPVKKVTSWRVVAGSGVRRCAGERFQEVLLRPRQPPLHGRCRALVQRGCGARTHPVGDARHGTLLAFENLRALLEPYPGATRCVWSSRILRDGRRPWRHHESHGSITAREPAAPTLLARRSPPATRLGRASTRWAPTRNRSCATSCPSSLQSIQACPVSTLTGRVRRCLARVPLACV
mmetsp:Transcript_71102/g.213877  ORF Transcript_71102/g.213877 Transcript_71102/m.213877 type:complete len:219 (+) Transcript_71102:890-1546(+)